VVGSCEHADEPAGSFARELGSQAISGKRS
jgi:hypothetical protein